MGWGGVVGWWWSRPVLGFRFSQAEQHLTLLELKANKKIVTEIHGQIESLDKKEKQIVEAIKSKNCDEMKEL